MNILLGITGGIAAYKSAELVRLFKKRGHDVTCVMTKSAEEFITPLTLGVLSNNPVYSTMFAEGEYEPRHIRLAEKADIIVVAPATANFMAKIANGIADDLLTATLLAFTKTALLVPAMNDNMWKNVVTQQNANTLLSRGYLFCGPGSGFLACGTVGEGRMSEPIEIADAADMIFAKKGDLAGKKILVTAGPTREAIDPVRFISNRSSGRMGYAIARNAALRGADVTLVTGPCSLPIPAGCKAIRIESTKDMLDAVLSVFDDVDIVFKAAAPADYTPKEKSDQKLGKAESLSLEMTGTPDVLKTLGGRKKGQILVGFAAETFDGLEHAKEKLKRKNLDLMVLNDVTRPGAGFDVDTNIVTVLDGETVDPWDMMTKDEVAEKLVTRALQMLRKRG